MFWHCSWIHTLLASGYSSEGLIVLICGASEQRCFFGADTLFLMLVRFLF